MTFEKSLNRESFDTKRKFGVEIEFISKISQCNAVAKINDYLKAKQAEGNPVADFRFESVYYSDSSNTWRIKTDSSIRDTSDYPYGLELVTPVLHGEADYERLKLAIEAINTSLYENVNGLDRWTSANRSCGLHVHVGIENWKIGNFKNLFKRYAKFQKTIDSLLPHSRRENKGNYCKSNWDLDGQLSEIFSQINKVRTTSKLKSLHNNYTRYVKLNLQSFWKHGTIEFRQHSGTVDMEKIINWLKVCMAMVECGDAKRAIRLNNNPFEKLNDNNYDVKTFFNGLSKGSDLINTKLRLFYNRRVKSLENNRSGY
tara:strand:- start:43 stop:984 length:942 start_codon:yes stop_codon:yes gene_type:complete